jgi:hypothetical protein
MLIITIITIYVIIIKIVKKIFKYLKILSSLQCKFLCYFSRILGGVYLPGSSVIFYMFWYYSHIMLLLFF